MAGNAALENVGLKKNAQSNKGMLINTMKDRLHTRAGRG